MNLDLVCFQFEQNEKDEGRFKFYFADLLYEPKLIINEKTRNKRPAKTQHPTYNAAVKEILINVFSQNHLDEKDCKKSFNGSKSLSFCSFLYCSWLPLIFMNSSEST